MCSPSLSLLAERKYASDSDSDSDSRECEKNENALFFYFTKKRKSIFFFVKRAKVSRTLGAHRTKTRNDDNNERTTQSRPESTLLLLVYSPTLFVFIRVCLCVFNSNLSGDCC